MKCARTRASRKEEQFRFLATGVSREFKFQKNAYRPFKGIVHFEIKFWYVLAYLKGIQDVGVFFSAVVSILIFLGQTVLVCQSYNAGHCLKEHAQSPN